MNLRCQWPPPHGTTHGRSRWPEDTSVIDSGQRSDQESERPATGVAGKYERQVTAIIRHGQTWAIVKMRNVEPVPAIPPDAIYLAHSTVRSTASGRLPNGAVVCCRLGNRRIRPGIWRLVVGWEAARP